MTEKEKKIIESFGFNIHESETEYDLETWTPMGVNMFINLDKKHWKEELDNYLMYFDIDDEIDTLRENDKQYKEAFTIRESLEDFEDYLEQVSNMVLNLEEGRERNESNTYLS